MTRLLTLLALFVTLFSVVACSDANVENQIRELQAKKTELEGRVQSLQVEVDSLRAANQKIQEELSALDMN